MLSQQTPHRRTKRYEINTDLILENGIPEVFREFTHGTYVAVIFLVARSARAVG